MITVRELPTFFSGVSRRVAVTTTSCLRTGGSLVRASWAREGEGRRTMRRGEGGRRGRAFV
ncbi:MAG: hypothetical protein MZW92_10250 [Comamonadaceae bacterium]|nr:hypothetical protein [Comamonadaceae bacterium]